MKKAFTLIELVISIIILSILMLFLYKSYSQLNLFNNVYRDEVKKVKKEERIKRTLYLDLTEAKLETLLILKEDKNYDFLNFSTNHSLHRRIKPYISYIVKESVLYRLESLTKIASPDIGRSIAFDIDKIGEVEKFKLYRSRVQKETSLFEIKFKERPTIFMKVKILN